MDYKPNGPLEEIASTAGERIGTLSKTIEVQKFLRACAINTISLGMDGDPDGMIFEIDGIEFQFRRK